MEALFHSYGTLGIRRALRHSRSEALGAQACRLHPGALPSPLSWFAEPDVSAYNVRVIAYVVIFSVSMLGRLRTDTAVVGDWRIVQPLAAQQEDFWGKNAVWSFGPNHRFRLFGELDAIGSWQLSGSSIELQMDRIQGQDYPYLVSHPGSDDDSRLVREAAEKAVRDLTG